MKYLGYVLILAILVLASCEDKKNTSEEKVKNTSENTTTLTNAKKQNKDSIEANEEKKKKKKDEIGAGYPKITQENVVDFYTNYGKDNPENKVKISTRLGDIYIDLYDDTPLHRANFIYLIKQGYFNETFFHRIVPNFIIQGGNSDLPSTNKKRFKLGDEFLLPAEINGRNHFYGSVSGAKEYRENPDKKTAPYEFFIFLGPETSTGHLNGNYTVFGRVSKGMDVVEKIAALPSDQGDWPLQNVYINAEVL
ncbi:peptidylprolyl isomerase [Marixanthomonas sp. SCSIO 43207]|uniref:peptidylprolyl isomerase n=1 Tax=Marixanthomonas sp. SCSIO 43207 TaxID=2779360 RepID=UPI001CAA06B5|nr:peptidylprolyl isomerase [Marixanthomonas sp. SCSIO 43207]UAB80489.1 peptidylprolyl isomerase [Marixanthomonas sp. SCSIO 43207]